MILGVGLVLPLYAIGEANAWGWGSARTLGLIGAGLVILALWVLVELRTAEPLVKVAAADRPAGGDDQPRDAVRRLRHVRLLPADPAARGGAGVHGLRLRASATGAGLLMLPGSVAMLGAGPLSGRLSGRYTPKLPLALGGVITSCGLLFLGLAHGSELQVMIGSLVMSIGIGFAFAAMPNLIVESVPPERTGEATGFNQLVRSVGSSLGSQISAAILAGSVGRRRADGRGVHRRLRRLGLRRPGRRHRLGADPARGRRREGRARGRAGVTRADAVRNRAAVLAAAEAVFAEHGTDAGVDLVAERAGVGKATVYRSFPTKETLLAEVVTRQLDAWLAGQRERRGRRDDRAAPPPARGGRGEGARRGDRARVAGAGARALAGDARVDPRPRRRLDPRGRHRVGDHDALRRRLPRARVARGGRPCGLAPPRRARRRRVPPQPSASRRAVRSRSSAAVDARCSSSRRERLVGCEPCIRAR